VSSIESIFENMPVSEGPEVPVAKVERVKNMGDRVTKGSTESRIEAFGEMLEDDDYAPTKPKPHEPIKVEKDKTAVAEKETVNQAKGEKVEDNEEDSDEEVQDGDEESAPVEEKPISIPKDHKFKVKVDGQEIEVTLDELTNGYSGKQAISKRFTEFDKKEKAFSKEKEQILNDQKYIQKEVNDLRESFKSQVDEFKKNGFNSKNPGAALDTLLDKIGVDSYSFNRAMFEHNLPEYAKFFEMDETGQEAYFVKKENEFFRKKEQTFAERTEQAQAQQQRQRQEFDLIKASGLTTDSYNVHFDELEALGAEDLSVEKVLEFAKVKPIFDKAGSIVAKTSKANDIALIQDVSRLLMEYPNTDEQEIIEHIDGTAEEKKAAKILKDKENFTVKKNVKKSSNNGDKYFTDEEMAEFQDIRRR
jgi:hypothetical protein